MYFCVCHTQYLQQGLCINYLVVQCHGSCAVPLAYILPLAARYALAAGGGARGRGGEGTRSAGVGTEEIKCTLPLCLNKPVYHLYGN